MVIKDNFCTRDIRTTAGSKILENFVPSYESGVTSRLLDAGAVILGKTNMDEFGMGSSTETSAFGPTVNPRGFQTGINERYVPGGSSGGSAAAVAANLCLGSVATDTGGSIRQPASFCGIVGFKPTYGVCSRWGIVAYASSLDQAGVITKTVQDAAILMDVIAGFDERDSSSTGWLGKGFHQGLGADLGSPTVAIPRQFRESGGSVDLEALWAEIERRVRVAGSRIVYIDMPHVRYSLPSYYIIALSEASSNLSRYDGVRFGNRTSGFHDITEMYEMTRAEGFGDEVKRRVLLGTFALSSGYYDEYYLRAAKIRALVSKDFTQAFTLADFVVCPTAPTPAFRIGERNADPLTMYLGDLFTVPANLAGLPAISIPGIEAENGMPMGMQVMGPRFSDDRVLSFARQLEGLR
jgi:aspartyl-tRNA(Asn)/glutamyl-tRNA(Gln) amidotransferase subunit A